MAIQEGNIVFLASQVMDDVPEGGGAATGNVIPDGVLNNVYEDISDLDRAYGRFNLRKLFVGVRSLDTDLYGGAKLAVTQLPNDPALGYALFTTEDPFDTRTEAADAVAAYLYKGSMWHGALLDNHIEGMKQIRIIQRVGSALPVIGKTLCLVQDEGEAGETEQYVRVTKAESVEAAFTDDQGDYQRLLVTLTLSDTLRFDFDGHTPSSTDGYNYADRVRVRDTTVADATNYFSSQPVAESAAIGDLRIRAASMFTQLVPSAQTETPLVSQIMAGNVMATLDAGGGHSVAVAQVAHTLAREITAENRRLNWIETLSPIPAPGTLSVAFMSQGNWYDLTDQGAGILSGADTGIGAGTINYTTGVVAVTLGALPDAGTQMLWTWASPVHYRQRLGTSADFRREMTLTVGEAIQPDSVLLTWISGGATKTATDTALGVLGGDASGYVAHALGEITLTFATAPDSGTQLGIEYTPQTVTEITLSELSEAGGLVEIDLGEAIKPGSLVCEWTTERVTDWSKSWPQIRHKHDLYSIQRTYTETGSMTNRVDWSMGDDGAGGIVDASGSVNYSTGEVVLPVLPGLSLNTWNSTENNWLAVEYVVSDTGSTAHQFNSGLVRVSYIAQAAASGAAQSLAVSLPPLVVRVLPPLIDEDIVPGSLRFTLGSKSYEDRGGGTLYAGGLEAGLVDYSNGTAALSLWLGVSGPPTVTSCLTRYGLWVGTEASFRTQLAPVKPEALSITVTAEDGEQLTASADADGLIDADDVTGMINYEFGTAALMFGHQEGEDWIPRRVDPSTLRYNAVAYSYLPLDADILGIDPVRLPSDGRVPIYRPGNIVMVIHTADATPATIANGGTLSAGRTRLAWVRVIDANGATVPGDRYTLDRAAGTVTVPDVAGLDQPLTLRHTVGDLRMVTDAQISGWLTLARALTHAYPANESLVAGCLIFGDRRARVSGVWDQASWSSVWADAILGSEATDTLNTIDYPVVVTNEGCDTDRWLFRCLGASTNAWELISEKRGLVWSGTYAPYVSGTPENVAPINPRTRTLLDDGVTYTGGTPYLTIPQRANGGGWSTGNVVRINTIGAIADFWLARSIQQSDEPADPAAADGCEIYALGNVDRP